MNVDISSISNYYCVSALLSTNCTHTVVNLFCYIAVQSIYFCYIHDSAVFCGELKIAITQTAAAYCIWLTVASDIFVDKITIEVAVIIIINISVL